jgi:hypothetical protein
MKKENKERVFSVELTSKNYLKNVTLTDGANENVIVEGTLGNLLHATFEEDVILEVAGTKGILRLDLRADEIKKTGKTEATKQ